MDGSEAGPRSVTASPERLRMLKTGFVASLVGLLVGGGTVGLRLVVSVPGTVDLLLWTGFALAASAFLGGAVAAHRFTPTTGPSVADVDYKRRLVPVAVTATALSVASGLLSVSLIVAWETRAYVLVFVSTALLSFCSCLLGGIVRLAAE